MAPRLRVAEVPGAPVKDPEDHQYRVLAVHVC